MRKLLFLFLITLITYVKADAQVKIAYVDSEVILKQLPEAQEIQKKLEDLQKLYVDTLTAMETDIKTKYETFKTKYEDAQKKLQEGKLSQEESKAIEAELSALQTEIQTLEQNLVDYKQNVQKILVNTQSELFKPVREKITKVISDLAKELKYNYVLDKASDALLFGDKEFDITFKVLDKLK